MPTKIYTRSKTRLYPLLTPKERLLAWEKTKGMWKNRKPDPIKELRKIRAGWERN